MNSPWLAMAGVAAILAMAVATAATLRRSGWVNGEVARKGVHVALGLTVAAFPWVFSANWPVWTLAGGSLLTLAALRWLPRLRRSFGGALHGVDRQSCGEFCLPIAVVVVWTLAPGDWLRYTLPLAILATADAVAALIGKRYGQFSYTTAGYSKSWEGSLAFAAATFLVVHVPLLLATDVGRAESLLIAVNLAVLLMLVEGLAWEGFDNLFIPVAAMILIDDWLNLPLANLGQCTAAILLLAAGCWWWRARTTLDDAAVLGCAVLGYVFWAAGGWRWLIAPVTLFVVYGRLARPAAGVRRHRAIVPFTILLPGLVWLLLDRRGHRESVWLLAAAGSFTTHLAAICLLHNAYRYPQRGFLRLLVTTWPLAALMTIIPTFLSLQVTTWPSAALAILGSLLGVTLLWWWLPDRRQLPVDDRRWWWQSVAAGCGSSCVLLKMLCP